MMKTYVKPDLCYESFELSQHIATCDFLGNYQDENTCVVEIDFGDGQIDKLFSNNACDDVDPSVFEDFCYTKGTSGLTIFTS